jgi:RNA polymerase sigma-70 factor (ECF subfamily)
MDTSDSLLGRLAAAPSDDDWQRLDDLYRPLLRAWMARAGVAASDVEDLVQDVLFVVSRKISKFERRGRGAFRTWLRAILANRVRDYFRGKKYLPSITRDSSLDEFDLPDSALSQLWERDHDEHVAAALIQRVQGDFKPVAWQPFRRHVMEGEPAVEVAKALKLSLNSVLLAKRRVVKRVRQELPGLVDGAPSLDCRFGCGGPPGGL